MQDIRLAEAEALDPFECAVGTVALRARAALRYGTCGDPTPILWRRLLGLHAVRVLRRDLDRVFRRLLGLLFALRGQGIAPVALLLAELGLDQFLQDTVHLGLGGSPSIVRHPSRLASSASELLGLSSIIRSASSWC